MSQRIALFACSTMALPSLEFLIEKQALACVVLPSKQDQLSFTLENYLKHAKIPYFRSGSTNREANLNLLKQANADTGIVFTYNEILTAEILRGLENGIFNIHASSLPQYRGPVPIFWQLKNQEQEVGVTLHKMTETIDAGPVVFQEKLPIAPSDTIGLLNIRVAQIAPHLINQLLSELQKNEGSLTLTEQEGEVSRAPTPKEEDIQIDWKVMSSSQIATLARACNPNYIGAQFTYRDSYFHLVEAEEIAHSNFGAPPGTIIHIGDPEGLIIASTDGSIRMNIVSTPYGILTGARFANILNIDAGDNFL